MSNRKIESSDANPKLKANLINRNPSHFENIKPKPVQSSEPVTDEPQRVIINTGQIHRPFTTFTEPHKILLQIFTKHIEKASLSEISEKIILPSKELIETRLYKNFLCQKCSVIKFKTKLRCGHSRCFSCLKSNLTILKDDPNLKNVQSIACKKCFCIPDSEEIKQILGENSSLKFEYPQIDKKCGYCRRDLSIYTEFFFELKCLHLCKYCYVDQLFMGIYKCMVCQHKFKNSKLTKQREDFCSRCSLKKNYYFEALKCYDDQNLLCYSCQNTSFIEGNKAILTSRIDGRYLLIPFRRYINKLCPFCHQNVTLSDILICDKCENFICEYCYTKNPECRLCFGSFKRN